MSSLFYNLLIHGRISFILLCCANCLPGFSQTNDTVISIAAIRLMPEKARMKALNRLSKKYSADSTDLSIELASEALDLAKRYNNRQQEAVALVNMAEGYLYNDLYDKAFICNAEALAIFNESGLLSDKALALTSLGWLYFDVEDPQNSLLYHQEVLEILRDSPDTVRLAKAFNAVGLAYTLTENYKKALPYFIESLVLGTAIKNKERISESLDNIGVTAMELGHYEESLMKLEKSYQLSKSLNDGLRQAETLNHISSVLIRLKRFKEAEQHFLAAKKLIEVSSSNSKKEFLLENSLVGTDLYEAMEDYKKALKHFREYHEVRKEILSGSKKNGLAQIRITYETMKREEKINLLEKEKELRLLQRNALGGTIILLFIISYLVFNQQRNKRRKEKQLSDIREALMKKVLEKEKLEKEVVTGKLEHKNIEMTNFALYISQRNDLLRSFLEELAKVQSMASEEFASKLGKVIHQFGQIQEVNKDAENFHLNIEADYKEFFFNLAQSFPDLTENEKRLCAQIRLNLSIKDIASINNVSVKSVEMARYRLRKRFKIGHDEIFLEWLKQF